MMHFAKYLFFPALLAAGAPDSIYDLATDDPELSTLGERPIALRRESDLV